MKIGILSDTHRKINKAKDTIEMLKKEGAEFLIHAGDIVEVEILQLLVQSKLKYIAVYGNNDAHLIKYHENYNLVQEPYYFKLADTKFKLMHLPYYMSSDSEVIIFGHTHEFLLDFTANGTLYINPGENCARNKPISESLMLEVLADKFLVTYYTRKEKDEKYKSKIFSYQRIKNNG